MTQQSVVFWDLHSLYEYKLPFLLYTNFCWYTYPVWALIIGYQHTTTLFHLVYSTFIRLRASFELDNRCLFFFNSIKIFLFVCCNFFKSSNLVTPNSVYVLLLCGWPLEDSEKYWVLISCSWSPIIRVYLAIKFLLAVSFGWSYGSDRKTRLSFFSLSLLTFTSTLSQQTDFPNKQHYYNF